MPQKFGMKVYDSDQYIMTFAGILVGGYADGEFGVVESDANAFEDVAGTDGEVSRSKTNDRRAGVTFKLMQTSDTNLKFSNLLNRDMNTPGGAGVGVLQIKDLQGTTVYYAAKAWLQKPPSASFDRTPKERDWVIRCAQLERQDGGN